MTDALHELREHVLAFPHQSIHGTVRNNQAIAQFSVRCGMIKKSLHAEEFLDRLRHGLDKIRFRIVKCSLI